MNVYSWNVNGIRAVERKKELQQFIEKYKPDILFIQEIKGTKDKFSKYLTENENYYQEYYSAEKAGYSGTGVWIKKSLELNYSYHTGMEEYQDNEGRVSRIDFDFLNKKFSLFGVYFPNGGKSKEAWNDKLVFYDKFHQNINKLREEGREVVWCGDVNCAHNEIDLARPDDNKNSIGFLPEEREWIDKLLENNWVDIYRKKYPEKVIYSWWHLLTRARARNVGWRIDYFFCDDKFYNSIKKIEYLNSQQGSDHCPVVIEF